MLDELFARNVSRVATLTASLDAFYTTMAQSCACFKKTWAILLSRSALGCKGAGYLALAPAICCVSIEQEKSYSSKICARDIKGCQLEWQDL